MIDPDHWLYRLSAEQWLRAADNELQRARAALIAKQHRQGLAGARRAAGMAWNAVLVLATPLDDSYGRSYMDHLKRLREDPAVPQAVRAGAEALLAAPMASDIVTIGPGDTRLADAAHTVCLHARQRVTPTASA